MKCLLNQIKPFFLSIIKFKKVVIKKPQRRWERGLKLITRGNSRIIIGKNLNCRRDLQIRALDGGIVEVGENVFINSNVNITAFSLIKIGSNCKIANNVVIVDHDHDYRNNNVGYIVDSVVIGDNVWIGANVTILKGVHIGNNSVIAAGAVIIRNVYENSIVGGIPGEKIGEVK